LVPFDDQATENVGASNANQIAANQDILCVDGHFNSGVALAALPTY
jgi:ABC-type branched-subunit amino acid transport system substrate-binding protein